MKKKIPQKPDHECSKCQGEGKYTVPNGDSDYDFVACNLCEAGEKYRQAEENALDHALENYPYHK